MDELGFFTLIAVGASAVIASYAALIWAAVQDGRDARARSERERLLRTTA
ncbi:MAG TPA: hypothetical protein VMT10_00020 [Solirubrobacteraceae bacterium]|nr:hypothetical protein [Solirubrobacteraceae bacterium]